MRHLMERGLTERRALAVARMSASVLRYALRPDLAKGSWRWHSDTSATAWG